MNFWYPPDGLGSANIMAWEQHRDILVVAIPHLLRCMQPDSSLDIFAFDPARGPGTVEYEFRTGLYAGGIALTSDDHLLAVDSNCLGVFGNHDPKLRVFDVRTGKKVREVSGRGSGVRYVVSTSSDGSRFLAFTGKMTIRWDWSDMVHFDKIVDETFSVWDARTYQGIVTSQNIPGLKQSQIRISSRGAYAISCCKASFVYALPQ